jgi:hypothetical protein
VGLAVLATPVLADDSGIFDVAIGKACWIEGYTNSGATWTVTVTNGEAVALVLEGTGVNFAPMAVKQGSARFDVTGGVEAKFAATYGGNAMDARVKFVNGSINSDSGDPAVFHTIVGGEDGGDDDWQDLILNVTCLHHAG